MKSSLDTCRPKNFDIMPVFEGTPIPCDLKKNICHWFGAAYNCLKILVLDCDIIVITGFAHFLNYGGDYQKCNQERGFGSRCRFCRKSWRNNGHTQYDAIMWFLLNPKKLILGSRFKLGHQLGLEVDYWERGSGIMRNAARSRTSQVRVPLLTTHYDLDHICLLF